MPGNFTFRNLDEETRKYLINEVEYDIENDSLSPSEYFNEVGPRVYPDLMRSAALEHDEVWLADQLKNAGVFPEYYMYEGKQRKVRIDAHTNFAQGEFNRFYIRALCLRVIAEGKGTLVVYRPENRQGREQIRKQKLAVPWMRTQL